MTDNINAFGATGKAKPQTSGSSGSSTPSINVETPPSAVIDFLMTAVNAGGGVAEYPVLSSNSTEVSDLIESVDDDSVLELLENLQDAGVEHLSLEGLLGIDLEGKGIEFIGTPPLLNESEKGEFSELDEDTKDLYNDDDIYPYGDEENGLKAYIVKPDWLDVIHEDRYDDTVINDANYAINGYWYPEISEQFEDEGAVRFKLSLGRNHNHQDSDGNVDHRSKRRHVAFSFESSGSTDRRIIKSAKYLGNISDENVDAYDDGEIDLDDIADLIRENRE